MPGWHRTQEREGTSLQSQLEACHKLALDRGYEFENQYVIQKEYLGRESGGHLRGVKVVLTIGGGRIMTEVLPELLDRTVHTSSECAARGGK